MTKGRLIMLFEHKGQKHRIACFQFCLVWRPNNSHFWIWIRSFRVLACFEFFLSSRDCLCGGAKVGIFGFWGRGFRAGHQRAHHVSTVITVHQLFVPLRDKLRLIHKHEHEHGDVSTCFVNRIIFPCSFSGPFALD